MTANRKRNLPRAPDPLVRSVRSWLRAAPPEDEWISVPKHLLQALVDQAARASKGPQHRPRQHWKVKREVRLIIGAARGLKEELQAAGVRPGIAMEFAIATAQYELKDLTPLAEKTVKQRIEKAGRTSKLRAKTTAERTE